MTQKQIDHLRRIASLGGQALVEKRGPEYMARIGREGYKATVERHFGGDYEKANRWLHKKGTHATDQVTTYGRKFADPGPHPAHLEQDESL